VSPPLNTRHRLRNRCHPSLFSAQHRCPHRCYPNLTQQHNTSPPLEDTGASLTTLTCQCHPLTTPTPATPLATPLTTPVPSQPHATMTLVPRSPPLTCQCHLSPPQHTGAPLHLQHHSRHHHSRHHPATPITARPQHLSRNIVLRVKWKARAIW